MHYSSIFLMIFAISNVYCNEISTCNEGDSVSAYLDVGLHLLSKAKLNATTEKAKDCLDLLHKGKDKSGVYEIWPMNRVTEDKLLKVYCDMDTDGGGWTVIQRRGNFQRAKDYFVQDWKDYKDGFGYVDKDFWLGNDNIFALTNQKLYSVRFDLKDFEQNTSYALYDEFWVDSESYNYTLHISHYTGTAGDSMISSHNNRQFSTRDRDNDMDNNRNCAFLYEGGWWYGDCYEANLNGLFYETAPSEYDGVSWDSWKGNKESLAWTEIKIRPKKFTFP